MHKVVQDGNLQQMKNQEYQQYQIEQSKKDMKCPKFGNYNPADDRFCVGCGHLFVGLNGAASCGLA